MPNSGAASHAARDVKINLRASQKQRSLIDRAAESVGKNRSDFMLEVACREAESVLLDRRYMGVDDEMYQEFMAALDSPPANNPRLRRLLAGAVYRGEATGRTRREMPDPVPVMVIGRLAIDSAYQGQGLGRALLRDASCGPCRPRISPESGRCWCTRSPKRPGGCTSVGDSSRRQSIR